MNEKPHIHIELRSNPTYLAGVRQLVASVAQRLGMCEATCSQIALAVDEALCNVICHGYGRKTENPIWISIWPIHRKKPDQTGMRIVIEDEADQVELCQLKSRSLDDPKPGGLGIHIIREVMDTVTYEKRSPRGMRVTMEKFATSAPLKTSAPSSPSPERPTGSKSA